MAMRLFNKNGLLANSDRSDALPVSVLISEYQCGLKDSIAHCFDKIIYLKL